MTLNNTAISAAQGLASFGWPVFPVNPDTKAPFITGWQNRATSDLFGVAELFKDYPSAAIGLITGQKSGLVVIDIDERENFSGLQNFKNAGHKLPPTITASTPSGGVHLFFKAPSVEVPNSVSKLVEGVDIRGDGGYVIAPPSVTKWGQYSWTCEYEALQEGPLPLPEKFYVLIEKKGLLTKLDVVRNHSPQDCSIPSQRVVGTMKSPNVAASCCHAILPMMS